MAQRTCKLDECERPVYGHGYCSPHWKKWRKYGDPTFLARRPKRQGVAPCEIDGCDGLFFNRGWCVKHYARWHRYGSPTFRLRGEVVDGKRICPRCDLDLPVETFEKYRAWCEPCALAYHGARRPAWVSRKTQPTPCDLCGEVFLADNRNNRYCSRDCAAANKNRANWKHLNARRARLRDAFVEVFDRAEVFERDGWVCGICRDAIDPLRLWPDPLSPSLDHIIPVSRGGLHARSNCQASHLACNVSKGATVPA